MKLHLPDVLEHLDRKPLLFCHPSGMTDVMPSSNATRRRTMAPLMGLMRKAEKFIFDSGSDQDMETVSAVRETAVEMIGAGLFHLPFPVIWVEDPYEGSETMRNYYLAEERETQIYLWFIQRFGAKDIGLTRAEARSYPSFMVHPLPMVIDLKEAKDDVTVLGAGEASMLNAKVLGEAVYGLKKFIVSLATDQLQTERVSGSKLGFKGKLAQQFDHNIVRIPMETSSTGDVVIDHRTGRPRRRHLVRGFVWGKNTRPLEEQHWVKPHWRGNPSLGTRDRSGYVVGRVKA